MKPFSLVLCAAAFAVASTVPAFADVVFQQTYAGPAGDNYGLFSQSTNVPLSNYAVFDNFTLANDTILTSIEWTGLDNRERGTISAFHVLFYANDGGNPGSLLYSKTVTGTANATYTGILQDYVGDYYDIDHYSTDIGFRPLANTEYWVSIVADTSTFSVWAWQTVYPNHGTYTDLYDRQYNPPSNDYRDYQVDMAFTLHDATMPPPPPPPAATPEPGSLVLMGSGMLTMAGMVRRRLARR